MKVSILYESNRSICNRRRNIKQKIQLAWTSMCVSPTEVINNYFTRQHKIIDCLAFYWQNLSLNVHYNSRITSYLIWKTAYHWLNQTPKPTASIDLRQCSYDFKNDKVRKCWELYSLFLASFVVRNVLFVEH